MALVTNVEKKILLSANINVDNAIKNGKNIIITGGGGVGKSYMIKKLNEKYKTINTASTGTAAINIKGETIHHLLRLFQSEQMLLEYIYIYIDNKKDII